MSKDQYLEMMEQIGEEPDWEKCPPDWEDFPDLVIRAVNIFHSMGDRIYPDIGYIGKDYTNFNFLLENYGVEEHNKEYILETILFLDSRAIEISQKKLKAEYDKMKRRS
jgi:hypothetical protein